MLRPGRHYRMLLVINITSGETSDEELEATLRDDGFQDPAVTPPQDWTREDAAALDWPEEPAIATAANEVLVRGKGAYFGDRAELFDRDRPIRSCDASYTVAACWECGPASRKASAERTGEAKPETKPENSKLIPVAIGAAAAAGLWWLSSHGKQEARDAETLAKLEERRERGELEERISSYLAHGATQAEAEAMAERHVTARAARQLAEDLEHGAEFK